MKWCSKQGHQGDQDHGGYIAGCNDCLNEKIMSDIPDIIEMHRKNDHTTKETLEKAAEDYAKNRWKSFRPDESETNRIRATNDFIAGAEWERERAKVLVEALDELTTLKHLTMAFVEPTQWVSVLENELKDKYEVAREALARYREDSSQEKCLHSWKTCHGVTYCSDCDAKQKDGS